MTTSPDARPVPAASPTRAVRPAGLVPAPSRPADPPPARGRAPWLRRRQAADLVAWGGAAFVGLAVGLWTLSLDGTASVASPAALAVTVSDLLGMLGVALLLLAVLLVARIPALERVVGLDRLTAWHRTLAPYGLYAVTGHVVLSVLGYAGLEGRGILPQAWQFVTGWPDMLQAWAGWFLMVAAGVTSYRLARRRLKFETWWAVHLYTYLAIFLSLFHQVESGTSLAGHAVARWVWVAAHVAVLAVVVAFRVAIPLWRSRTHALRLESVHQQARGTISLVLRGRHLERLEVEGGQFFHLRVGRRGMWWQAHPYSVSGLPAGDRMRFTISDSGDYARAIAASPPGTRVFVEGPYGAFTARSAEPGRRLLLVAGGVGITPVRTILDDLPADSRPVVVYRARSEAEVLFADELERLVVARGGSLHVLVGDRTRYPLDVAHLRAAVPDLREREVYVCGGDALVTAVRRAALAGGVPAERFHAEEFSW